MKRIIVAGDGDEDGDRVRNGGVEGRGAREEEKVRELKGVVRGLRRGGDVKVNE